MHRSPTSSHAITGLLTVAVFGPIGGENVAAQGWRVRAGPRSGCPREDPDTFAAPFTMRLTITEQPGYQVYE
jgi:hypothetical protein